MARSKKDKSQFLTFELKPVVLMIGSIYLSITTISLTIQMLLANYLNINPLQRWSYLVADKPWVPDNSKSVPLIGQHYFGDFQLPFFLSKDSSPYLVPIFNNILPVGNICFKFLSELNLQLGFIVFISISFFLYFHGLNRIFNLIEIRNRSIKFILVSLAVFNLPFIVTFDRGSLNFIICGLIMLVIARRRENPNEISTIITLVLLASFKVSLIPVIVIYLLVVLKNNKSVIRFVIYFLLSNAIVSFLYGGPFYVANSIISSLLRASGQDQPQFIYDGVSFNPLMYAIIRILFGAPAAANLAETYPLISLLPSLIYFLFVIFFVRQYCNSFAMSSSLVFSMYQYITPVSYFYNCLWVVPFILLNLSEIQQSPGKEIRRSQLILVFGLFAQIIPSGFYVNWNIVTSGIWAFSVFSVAIFLVLEKSHDPKNNGKL